MGRNNKKFSLSRILIIICMIGFVIFLWRSYGSNRNNQAQTAIPVIRADISPIKEPPSNPGGMEIPFRDSTIFETLETTDNNDSPRIENLLAEPRGLKAQTQTLNEEEVTEDVANNKKQIKAEKQSSPESAIDTLISTLAENNNTQDAIASEHTTNSQSTPVPQEKPSKRTVTAEKQPDAAIEKITPAVTKTDTKIQTDSATDFYVQLGSLSSESAAQNAWKRFQSELPSDLQNLSLRIEKADLGPRGIYYRVQAGPLIETKARAICTKINAKRKGGCLVTKIR